MAQRDVKQRIDSVKNIRKITSAMQMVAAARLRRAEQRIDALRPYAGAIRRMTRRAAQAAGAESASLPIMQHRDTVENVAIMLVTADRGLAGAFNSQIIRAGLRYAQEYTAEGVGVSFYASGRRGVSSLVFRNFDPVGRYVGFTDRPTYDDARRIAEDLIVAFVDGKVDRVELIYNAYVSPLVQEVRRETLLPVRDATISSTPLDEEVSEDEHAAQVGAPLVEYEPDPDAILERLVPDYVEISVYRALLESTASEHGARMTAMRSASDNAAEVIEDLTLEMNRARQAEITQEIMEVVAGAESLT